MFYVIEALLPFSIRLPLNETIEFTFNQRMCGLGQPPRSLSENREPTAEKPFWSIFSLILVKYE